MDEIEYTGRNGAEVREWVNSAPGNWPGPDAFETWFLTRGMSAGTSGQAWNYARGDQHWPQKVKAAVYDARSDTWLPVRAGDLIVREGEGYAVRTGR